VVEDNTAVRRLAADALARRGYRVIEATNGREGLDRVTDELPSLALVITDVVMPVMGGREMVTRLRASRPDLRVIFTSGYAQEARGSFAVREPGTTYIHKPFSPAALCRTVREMLDEAGSGHVK
jgi:two-component system cell cycle sensor histidine kinase/response regulator CckA